MLSSTVEQTTQTVKTTQRQRLVYRKPIVGGLVEATVIRDSGDWLRVQVEGEPYPKSIHVTDIVSWVLDSAAPAANASETAIEASPRAAAHRPTLPISIRRIDPALALDRYSHLAAERYARLESEKLYYAIPATWTNSAIEIEKSRRAYERVEHHVQRLEALARGDQPAFWRSACAWMQLEDWRQRGRPKYEATPDELMNACVCGNDPDSCTCPKEEAPEPERRGYNPWSLMIAGRV